LRAAAICVLALSVDFFEKPRSMISSVLFVRGKFPGAAPCKSSTTRRGDFRGWNDENKSGKAKKREKRKTIRVILVSRLFPLFPLFPRLFFFFFFRMKPRSRSSPKNAAARPPALAPDSAAKLGSGTPFVVKACAKTFRRNGNFSDCWQAPADKSKSVACVPEEKSLANQNTFLRAGRGCLRSLSPEKNSEPAFPSTTPDRDSFPLEEH